MDKEILIIEKHEKMELIFSIMLKYYKHTYICYSVEFNRIFIKRTTKSNRIIAFYHFDFYDFEVRSSYWNNHKNIWINKLIII